MKIRAPKKIIETNADLFLPAPELDKFVKDHYLNENSKLFNNHHLHLRQARIAYLWTNVENSRQMRSVAATAEMPKPPTIGNKWDKAKYRFQMLSFFGSDNFDFLITLNGKIINEVSPIVAFAILDHELYHCGQRKDEFGAPKYSRTTGKPVFGMRGHDVEEFVGIWERYGYENAAGDSSELAKVSKQKPLIGKAELKALCGTCMN